MIAHGNQLEMYAFVGLGNCGERFENTRHNFGFLSVDSIRERYALGPGRMKFNAEIFRGTLGDRALLLVKPTTFMNNSGIAVARVKSFYRIPNENIFVFHDDLDLKLCRVKVKTGGGSGGHNGLESIDSMIGRDYSRVRLGVGRPDGHPGEDMGDFVLGKFSPEEMERVRKLNSLICDNILELFDRRDNFLNKIALAGF
ncbi:MAG: aminoacyl-tRNA hydrolase [Rickettsiales bacterium]|jgi:PTH1 family peptidyl-tRNA hydrolase|nr:aminoacyl-tRNA hydrolase [Rickettsiales bacterium]